jgi:hypothetical protein
LVSTVAIIGFDSELPPESGERVKFRRDSSVVIARTGLTIVSTSALDSVALDFIIGAKVRVEIKPRIRKDAKITGIATTL